MVDFNNDTTITTPASEIVKILILQRRNDFIEANEVYLREKYSGIETPDHIIRARLMSLFLEIQAALKRNKKKDDYDEITALIQSDDYKDLLKAYTILNTWLDESRLIRIDTRQQYDRTIAENENESYNL